MGGRPIRLSVPMAKQVMVTGMVRPIPSSSLTLVLRSAV